MDTLTQIKEILRYVLIIATGLFIFFTFPIALGVWAVTWSWVPAKYMMELIANYTRENNNQQ